MLRITRLPEDDPVRLLVKLEGKLIGPWVPELERAFELGEMSGIRLDLTDVTFVDAAGAACLRRLLEHGAQMIACSGYVTQLLETPSREVQ